MAYFSGSTDTYSGLGCGPSCKCTDCKTQWGGMSEVYEPEERDGSPRMGYFGEIPCPAPERTTTSRCTSGQPHVCPRIPNLVCVSNIIGVNLESVSVSGMVRDSATGLLRPPSSPPRAPHRSRVLPSVVSALESFVDHMRRFGLPIDAILTAGSLVCRCISGTDRLSNHSYGDAFDLVGVRWLPGLPRPSRLAETIVHNFGDLPGERILLRRINACLRLSFARVIDYHRADHRDHFHCDMNRGRGRVLREPTTVHFLEEALEYALGRPFARTGRLAGATLAGLREYAGLVPTAPVGEDMTMLTAILDSLCRFVASAGRMR